MVPRPPEIDRPIRGPTQSLRESFHLQDLLQAWPLPAHESLVFECLAIEGNSLSLDQVTAILEGKKVLGPPKDILEVQNANAVYDLAKYFDPFSVSSMLRAHGILMQGILPDAGKWRSGAVGIVRGSRVAHVAPKAQYVQGMIKEILKFAKDSKITPLITSSVFHHEFEFIHPFTDGNGRMGRLWQHLLLVRHNPVFEFVPVESIVRDRQAEYYKALKKSDRAGNSTIFGMTELLGAMRVGQVTPEDRLEMAREKFKKNLFSRKDYLVHFIKISAPTASRDLKLGLDRGLLERKGEKALTRYRFKETGG